MGRIDLTPFCSRDPFQPKLDAPFARGEWVYATNGHICVRVPRAGRDVGEVKGAPDPASTFDKAGAPPLRPLPKITLPERAPKDCPACDGRGTKHECPDCECLCGGCGGSGRVVESVSVGLGGVPFDARYVRLMMGLPDIRIAENPPASAPMVFAFAGGAGLLMPCRKPFKRHIDADAPQSEDR